MRLFTIDVSRTLAIILMILVHFTFNLSGVDLTVAHFSAPIFTFLMGLSYYFWLRSKRASGTPDALLDKITIRRGILTFGVGLAFNVIVWMPEDIFTWDILTLLGVAMMLFGWLRRFGRRWLLVVGLFAIAVAPLLRNATDYDAFWEEGFFDYDWSLSDIASGFFSNGYFPIFPWLFYPIFGYLVGSFAFEHKDRIVKRIKFLLLGGGALSMVGLGILLRSEADSWSEFPASSEFLLVSTGVSLLLFCVGYLLFDRSGAKSQWLPVGVKQGVELVSQYSLSIYIVHHILHLWPLWIYGVISSKGTFNEYFRDALPFEVSLTLGILCVLGAYPFVRWLHGRRKWSLESWIRKRS